MKSVKLKEVNGSAYKSGFGEKLLLFGCVRQNRKTNRKKSAMVLISRWYWHEIFEFFAYLCLSKWSEKKLKDRKKIALIQIYLSSLRLKIFTLKHEAVYKSCQRAKANSHFYTASRNDQKSFAQLLWNIHRWNFLAIQQTR